MKLLLSMLFMTTILNSCNNDTQEQPDANVDVTWGLVIIKSSGEDLLHPSTSGYYNYPDINYYQITDGIKIIINSGESMIQKPTPSTGVNNYVIAMGGLGTKVVDNPSYPIYESFLELNSNTIDTIKVETFEPKANQQILSKVWYNGKLVWKTGNIPYRLVTIIK